MKKLFYAGLLGLTVFEICKVYLIMPMPGSQQMDRIDIAYFLHTYRWLFRIVFVVMIFAGSIPVFKVKKPYLPLIAIIPVIVIIYFSNFKMAADRMFLQPKNLVFKSKGENLLSDSSIVVAVHYQGKAKAYPIRFILYHHQVRDTIAGKPIMVTYCNVCRTGRVFEPIVKGKIENFRLVGMDHFNAMFEDETTKSWWRQATGEAVTGSLKGNSLAEVESNQFTLNKFFSLYPYGEVMQMEDLFKNNYDSLARFEKGKTKSSLTRSDSLSWKNKSWVLGIQIENAAKAYDWIDLKQRRVINDRIGKTPIVIALSADDQSFVAFERPSEAEVFTIRNDTLIAKGNAYDFSGRNTKELSYQLKRVKVYQEFWHSWQTFHPETALFR
jgi:hypothetical protein